MNEGQTGLKWRVGTVVIVAAAWLAACGEAPQSDAPAEETAAPEASAPEVPAPAEIQTPIGTFTVVSVRLADEFCQSTWDGQETCDRPLPGYRYLILETQNDESASDPDYITSIQEDMNAARFVSNTGEEWPGSSRMWNRGGLIQFVRVGPGTPESFELHWPGNDPITLTPRGG